MKVDFFPSTYRKNVNKVDVGKSKGFYKQVSSSAMSVEKIDGFLLLEQDLLTNSYLFEPVAGYKNEAHKKGQTLLTLLTALRVDLLSGNVPYSRIQQLNHLMNYLPDNIDPLLQDVLDEITLRVQIELTKIEKTL